MSSWLLAISIDLVTADGSYDLAVRHLEIAIDSLRPGQLTVGAAELFLRHRLYLFWIVLPVAAATARPDSWSQVIAGAAALSRKKKLRPLLNMDKN